MKKLKFYQLAAAGLLLLNLVLLTLLLWQPRFPPPPGGHAAIELFNLSEEQNDTFLALAEQHKEKIGSLNARHEELIKEYLDGLKTSAGQTTPLPPAVLVELETKKVVSLYDHLSEVKAILTPDQMEAFPEFVDALTHQIFSRERRKLPGKRRNPAIDQSNE
ncbi:hypothetical protein CEQ90_05860 [Lewinellaceae bacterium SD302]|nr:hypothetical protein CEQ90_05860 [Lewinellaceae bacterium SD302]